MRKQRVALKHGIDVTVFGRRISNVLVIERDTAAISRFQPGNQAQNGGFATARRAEQGDELTVMDGQVKIINDGLSIKSFTDARKRNQRLLCACLRHFSLSLSKVEQLQHSRSVQPASKEGRMIPEK